MMVERIANASKFQISGGKLEKAVYGEANRDQAIVKPFIEKYNSFWLKWAKARGPHVLSPFLEVVGGVLFFEFLTKFFKFNDSIQIKVMKGQSNVDSQIKIDYIFKKEELEVLKQLKKKFNIINIPDEYEFAKMLLSNCVKSIARFLSNIMNIKYRFFTSKIDGHLKDDKTLEINLVYDGRIG